MSVLPFSVGSGVDERCGLRKCQASTCTSHIENVIENIAPPYAARFLYALPTAVTVENRNPHLYIPFSMFVCKESGQRRDPEASGTYAAYELSSRERKALAYWLDMGVWIDERSVADAGCLTRRPYIRFGGHPGPGFHHHDSRSLSAVWNGSVLALFPTRFNNDLDQDRPLKPPPMPHNPEDRPVCSTSRTLLIDPEFGKNVL